MGYINSFLFYSDKDDSLFNFKFTKYIFEFLFLFRNVRKILTKIFEIQAFPLHMPRDGFGYRFGSFFFFKTIVFSFKIKTFVYQNVRFVIFKTKNIEKI